MARSVRFTELLTTLEAAAPTRVSGTALYLTAQPIGAPVALVQNVRFNKALHQHVVVLTVSTLSVPRVADDHRPAVQAFGSSITVVPCRGCSH